MIKLALLLCLLLAQPLAAQDDTALTRAELTELAGMIEAALVAGGDYARAEENARALYPLVTEAFGTESREAVQVELLVVLALTASGQTEAAGALGRQMVEKVQRLLGADDPLAYRAVAAYGAALRQAGRGDEALALLSEALTLADGALPPGDLAVSELRLIQAQLAAEAGAPDLAGAAYRLLDQGLAGKDDAQSRSLRAIAMLGWARLVQDYQGPEAALPLLRATLAAMDAAYGGLTRPRLMPLRLTAEGLLIEALQSTGAQAEALDLLNARLPEIAAHYGEDSPFWADMAFRLAVLLAGDAPGSPGAARALDLMQRVVAVRAATLTPDTVDLLRARINLAMLLAAEGQGAAALEQVAALEGAALPGARMQLTYILRTAEEAGTLSRQEAVGAMLDYLQKAQDSGAAAAQILLGQRLQAGSDAAAAALRARSDAEVDLANLQAGLAAQTALPLAERDSAEVARLRAAIRQTTDRQAAIDHQIATDLPALAGVTRRAALSLDDIRAGLGPDGALVLIEVPLDPGDPGLIIAVSREAVDWHTLPVSGPEVAAGIATLRDSIDLRLGLRGAAPLEDATATPPDSFDLAMAHTLYRQLLAPVAEVTQGKAQLYLDLRGPVAALPLQLLVATPPASSDFSQADWLIRHHAITILPAISALRPAAAAQAPAAGLLAFADPRFDALAPQSPLSLRGGLAPLPETAGEVRAVARALRAPEDSLLLGEAASEAALKSADLAAAGLLYFATHGLVSGDSVGEAALPEPALALTPGQGEDGFLTASEIVGLHLNARFVVLSACNTAAGGTPGAEALSGLAQSFLYAGARGLLVSHWPVESRSAVALMTGLFNRRAADPGLTAAQAQRQAIVDMIDHPADPRWSHPAYWAPFIVVGQPG